MEEDNEIKVDIKNDNAEQDNFYDVCLDNHVCSCNCLDNEFDDKQCNCEKCLCHDKKETSYNEEVLPRTLGNDFEFQIIERGEKYYDDGRVFNIYKNKNEYYAKVEGHNHNVYDVKITVNSEDDADYECNCACDYPCKHAYALISAIANREYEEVHLKEDIMPSIVGVHEMIEQIPAEELKKYLLSDEGRDNTDFCICSFNNYFRTYLPKQSYEYYYNNLYNALVLDNDFNVVIDNYLSTARTYLKDGDYSETFKIIQSIIEAGHDTDMLDVDDDDFELINKIAMLLRILYRKGNLKTRMQVKEWNDKLIKNNYYNNYYLEDAMLSLE